MANIFLAFLLFSVILLILGAEVFINFTYRGKLVTKVDILFFTVILYKDEQSIISGKSEEDDNKT